MLDRKRPEQTFHRFRPQEVRRTMLEFLGARREFIEQWLAEDHCPVQAW